MPTAGTIFSFRIVKYGFCACGSNQGACVFIVGDRYRLWHLGFCGIRRVLQILGVFTGLYDITREKFGKFSKVVY